MTTRYCPRHKDINGAPMRVVYHDFHDHYYCSKCLDEVYKEYWDPILKDCTKVGLKRKDAEAVST